MEIEFIEETHQYLIDGVLAPSVSELISFIYPDKYKGIPDRILKEKTQFGTNIHKAIEKFENGLEISLTEFEKVTFEQYLKVKEKYNLSVIAQEKLVHFEDKYCGRLDMIADVNYYRCLIDIKTTASLDEKSLAWQLGLYKLAYQEPIEKCYCLWLPKNNLGKLVEIQPKSKKEILELLERYENSRNA